MSDTTPSASEQFAQLNDHLWRRLGVTETFERLLVEAAGVHPGPSADVAAYASRNLSGGAARFWELSWNKLERDLCRKRVLIVRSNELTLHDEFTDRLERLLSLEASGVSRVEPTPGVTVESIQKQAEERARKAAKKTPRVSTRKTSSASVKAPPMKRTLDGESTPMRTESPIRSGGYGQSAGDAMTPKKLFTSIRVNRLLDHLDNTTLSTSQLGTRLELRSVELNRFLEKTNELDITRVTRDDLVELYWRGRELARTTDADRRMTVLGLVKELRAHGEAGEES